MAEAGAEEKICSSERVEPDSLIEPVHDFSQKQPSKQSQLKCPQCGSDRLYKDGLRYLGDGTSVQRWLCRNCGYRFTDPKNKDRTGWKNPPSGLNPPSASYYSCQGNNDPERREPTARKAALTLATVEKQNEKRAAGATKHTAQQDVKGKIIELLWKLERNGRKQGTIANYRKNLMKMFRQGVNLLEPEDCKAWLAKTGLAASTKRNIAIILDKWFEHLGVAWIKPIYYGEPEIPFIPTEQELDSLISAVGKKMACYLQLLKETGARCGEISNLRWTDVDSEQKTVRVKGEKGSYPRMLPISNKAVEMLKNLPKTGERLFADANAMRTCFYVQRKRVARKLGNPRLQQISFHTFRHWKGTMLYHQTKDVYYVKEHLGHKNLQSTQVYIHIEKAMFRNTELDDYHVKVAKTQEEITQLLETGFEYVLQKDGLAFFRKRK
ncbi:MAG: tyrosine-type recombinase/integrase [Candidatus Bathyarchaeia archaeon]|jgi:integrase/DNA-directed RNA polymerase subunit RPC12/RpoP